jgi:hypothetical protein
MHLTCIIQSNHFRTLWRREFLSSSLSRKLHAILEKNKTIKKTTGVIIKNYCIEVVIAEKRMKKIVSIATVLKNSLDVLSH